MSEHELQPLSTQASLLAAVDDLDGRFEALAASLESLRAAVRIVGEQVRGMDAEAPRSTPLLTVVEAPVEPEAQAEAPDLNQLFVRGDAMQHEVEPVDEDIQAIEAAAAALNAEAAIEKLVETSPEAAHAPSDEERDAVRKAVEATRAELSWSNLRVDSGFSFGPKDETPAVEHEPLFGRVEDDEPSDMPGRVMPGAVDPDEERRREEARRAVEAARAEFAAVEQTTGLAESTPVDAEETADDTGSFSFAPSFEMTAIEPDAAEDVDDEEARREEVRRAVEAARASLTPAQEAASDVDPEEARREEVRLAVERARAEMLAGQEAEAVDDDEARRAEVRRMVENTRGAMSWSEMRSDGGSWGQFKPEPGGFSIGPEQAPPKSLEPAPLPSDPEEARREEVRRAVEAARADMNGGPVDDAPRIVPIVPRPGQPGPRGADFSGPPIIVIEDSSGRVELSQVFATLSKVDQTAQAALLNYSPHSVTIGLNMQAQVPDADQLRLAAQSVFGRACSVKTDGNRTAIEVGTQSVG